MSILKVNTLQNTSGVEVYTVKAWVNFNGTGTIAIRASGNVSSITDNGSADYTINFTTAMTDANYATIATTTSRASSEALVQTIGYASTDASTPTTYSTTAVRLSGKLSSGAGGVDTAVISVAVFR